MICKKAATYSAQYRNRCDLFLGLQGGRRVSVRWSEEKGHENQKVKMSWTRERLECSAALAQCLPGMHKTLYSSPSQRKEGRKERKKKGRKEGRKEGMKGGREGGRKERGRKRKRSRHSTRFHFLCSDTDMLGDLSGPHLCCL
jgi:flagellar biosynthesis/type III secretory pathway protein FliH